MWKLKVKLGFGYGLYQGSFCLLAVVWIWGCTEGWTEVSSKGRVSHGIALDFVRKFSLTSG